MGAGQAGCRHASGRLITDPVIGINVPQGPPAEKGVDVMCALVVLRHARRGGRRPRQIGVLDSDLIPALDSVVSIGPKSWTFSWWSPNDWSFEMYPE